MTASQLLLSILIVFIITRTIIAYRKKNLSETFTLVWVIFWIFGLVLIFQQQLVISVANAIGISRGVDLVIYFSLIFIFYLIYRFFVKIEEMERTITELVRKLAIKDAKKSK